MTSQSSNKSLSSTLQRLGYGSIDETANLPVPDCDWMLNNKNINESTQAFLLWLCNNLQPSNVLMTDEIKRYQELQAQGNVLEGAQLEDALVTMRAVDDTVDMESLKQEVAELQNELAKANSKLSYMVSDRAKIATLHAHMTHRSAELAAYNDNLQEVSATLHQKLLTSVNETKEVIKTTESTISELVSLHEGTTPYQKPVFLSHMPFEPYFDAEKSLTKKIDEMLIASEERDPNDALKQYAFAGVTDIPPALAKVEPENIRNEFTRELDRIRLHYEKSVILEVDAQMRAARGPAEEEALREWDEAFEHFTEEDLTNQLIATQEGLASTEHTIRNHLSQTVPQLARALAQLQVLPVLEADTNEQIESVQNAIDSQETAITHLLHQKSRLDFLKANLLYEETKHNETHTLIAGAIRDARNVIGQTIQPPAPTPPQSSIVDMNVPSTLSRAHLMLEKFSPAGLSIVTRDTIASSASNLSQTLSTVEIEKEKLAKEREAMISQLWLHIFSLNGVLFAPQSTTQPQLANPELITANEELEKLLKVAESMLGDLIQFQKAKQEEMRYWGPDKQKERDVYVYFFNHPEKLVQMCAELKQRVEAGKIRS